MKNQFFIKKPNKLLLNFVMGEKNHSHTKSTSNAILAILRISNMASVCALTLEAELKQQGCVGTMAPSIRSPDV